MNKDVMRYPAYKHSGIDWLGEIPSHWQLKPLKYVVDIDSEKLKDSENPDLELEYIDISSVDSGGNILKREKLIFENAPSRARRIVQKGDTILATVRTYLRAITQIDYDSELPQICSTGFAVLRPVNIHARYLFYWVRSDYFIDEIVSRSVGVSYPAISSSEVGNLNVPIIPIEEQIAIASYLDHQTTRIDQLIEKKKRLLDLLDEQRQAIITNAVTKGINPDAPMKDSGIDWLGEVPEHWEVTRLKYFLSEPLKYGANEAAELEDHDSPRYIRITDIKDDGTLKNETYKSLEFEVAKPYLLKDGDVLLARSGATVGKTFQYRSEWGISDYAGYLIRARFVNQKTADWFYYFSKSKAYWDWLKSTFIQATIQNVSAEKYSNLFFSVPPQEEIDQILSYLDQQTSRIDQLKIKIQTAIKRLEEYRSSLITQAVTGKIDVRDMVNEVEMSYAAEEGELYKTNE